MKKVLSIAIVLLLALSCMMGLAIAEEAAPAAQATTEAAEPAAPTGAPQPEPKETFLDKVVKVNGAVNGVVWGWPAMILILGVGLYLTLRSRGLQFRKFGYAMKETLGKVFHKHSAAEGSITPWQAVCTALAATVGTGNVAGVAGAICLGGPGAVFWMWVSALLGMCTKFAEVTLAVRFREKNVKGEWVGGPMYYIKNGLGKGWKWLGVLFALFGALAAFGIGNATQAGSIKDSINSAIESFGGAATTRLNLIVGIVLGVLALATDCMRVESPWSAPHFALSQLSALLVLALGRLLGEMLTKRLCFDALRARSHRRAWMASVVLATLLNLRGLSALGALNALLMAMVGCALYERGGLLASAALQTIWAAGATLLLGFPGMSASTAAVWPLYHVSDAWLTGGSVGPMSGAWFTLLLSAALLILLRQPLVSAVRKLRSRSNHPRQKRR